MVLTTKKKVRTTTKGTMMTMMIDHNYNKKTAALKPRFFLYPPKN